MQISSKPMPSDELAPANPPKDKDAVARDEAQTERQAPPGASPGEPAAGE